MEILRRSGGDEQKAKPVTDMMQRQVGQMVRLVDDLLDVSRISRDKIELRREPIDWHRSYITPSKPSARSTRAWIMN